MLYRQYFDPVQLALVDEARQQASALVTEYYRLAPREWQRMRYEVRTLRLLDDSEVSDSALAQTLCYEFKRQAGASVLDEGQLFRICLQDHRILDAARRADVPLRPLLTYVLTHEFVHVVRFGQQMQRIDLPEDLRGDEEQRVEVNTRVILDQARDPALRSILAIEWLSCAAQRSAGT